jgi:O-antigen ligase
MITLALVSFVWGTANKKKKLFFNLPVLILNLSALILSFSRGGMVQVFLSMAVIGYLYYMKICSKKFSWQVILPAVAILAITGLAINYYEFYMRVRIASHSEADYQRALYHTKTVSDYLRKHVAMQALRSSLKHPFLGVGFNLFTGKYIAGGNYFGLASHNQFLKILVEMGLFGFIPFIIMLATVGKTGMNMWKKSGSQQVEREIQIMVLLLLSGVTAVAFGYLFTDSLVMLSVTGYLWVFSGAIFVLDRQYNKEESAHNS